MRSVACYARRARRSHNFASYVQHITDSAAYGSLGGNQDNPMVQLLVSLYLEKQVHVLTYNARGVLPSQGRVSWTMQSEARDMQCALDYAMQRATDVTGEPSVFVAGYSAGSMHASCVRVRKEGVWANAQVSYLLLSYPLGVRWLLTCFQTRFFVHALDELIRTGTPVSIVYGTQDQFTSAKSYASWSKQLQSISERVRSHSVAADHFWNTRQARSVFVELFRQ